MITLNGTPIPQAEQRMCTDIELGVLGAFRARTGSQWQAAPTRQVARVATILAGWPGEFIERDRIISGIWGDNTPPTVTNTLQVHVSHLRRMIGRSTVKSRGTSYALDVVPEAIDAEQFVEFVHEAARMRRRAHYGRAAEFLDNALTMWRGTPFADVQDPDLEARRARLTELKDQAKEDLLECRLELCRDRFELADVIAEAKELVSREPERERGHALLVRALAAADRTGEASLAFEQAAARTRSTLGLEPSRELVDVHAMSLTRDERLLPQSMRAIHLLPPKRPSTPEIEEIGRRVRELVTDFGPRLITVIEGDVERARKVASAIAHRLIGDLPTGVVLVDDVDADFTNIKKAVATVTNTEPSRESHLGLVIVVCGSGPNVVQLVAETSDLDETPIIITVGSQPIGEDAEVVVDSYGNLGGNWSNIA